MNTPTSGTRTANKSRSALFAGAVAAILASSCCIGPLVLITLGFSGAWIGNLTVLEPYRLWFVAAAVVALFFAWRSIWQPAAACAPDQMCAVPRVKHIYTIVFGVVAALVVLGLVFPSIAHWFY